MRTQTVAVPILTTESGLTRYLEQSRRFPLLEPQEEYMQAKSCRERGDRTSRPREEGSGTGITSLGIEVVPKQLELMHEVVPTSISLSTTPELYP
jgi:hypothetical protein